MLPGLFRTLVGLVVAWFVFRFLDRMFGGRRGRAARPEDRGGRPESGQGNAGRQADKAKDDHLGEYVDFEEIEEDGKE